MKLSLTIARRSALALLVAAATLAACSGNDDGRAAGGHEPPPASRPAGGHEPAPASRPAERAARPAPPSRPAAQAAQPADAPDETRFACPAGGIDEVTALQQAVDEGHQPWRLSATYVAAACTFGVGGTTVEPAGENRYEVTEVSTGDRVLVELAQPLGPDGIWVASRVTSLPPA
jgi:hypothetical protein